MKINVDRIELVNILYNNRSNHKTKVEKALQGYRAKCLEILEERAEMIRKGQKPNMYIHLQEPIDQTDDYDSVIGLLEMSKDKTIELSEHDYRNYVLDKWEWSQKFSATNSAYYLEK